MARHVNESLREPPDRNEQVDYFNATFYLGDPSAYLRTRLQMLLLVATRSNELSELSDEGLTFEGVTIAPSEPAKDPEIDHESVDRYVTTEIVLLQHHAAEAALRIYTAHATKPALPWIDLADRRKFWEFKAFVRTELVDGTPDRAEIGRVCLGNRMPPEGGHEDDWESAIDGLTAFLRSLATVFLDDAPVYNALKHGLRATPSNMSFTIGGIQVGHGASISYPEVTEWDTDEHRLWSLTTRWFDRTEAIGLIEVAIRMIDSIMKVGKAATTAPSQRPTHLDGLFYPSLFRPKDLRSGDRTGPAQRIQMPVIEERKSADSDNP